MKNLLIMVLSLLSVGAFAQMQINKPVQLTGSGADAKIEGIQEIVNNNDAANKIYVDTAIANRAGGGFTHYIGEQFGGGVVFYVYESGGNEHGLIAHLTDNATSQQWSNVTNTEIGATAQSRWDGLSNSNAVVGQIGHSSSAAKVCLDYTDGTYSDWYLPAIEEMKLLQDASYEIYKNVSGYSYVNGYYWSSTEFGSNPAWSQHFLNDYTSTVRGKHDADYVRCIRAF